jgi:hypothetical protein
MKKDDDGRNTNHLKRILLIVLHLLDQIYCKISEQEVLLISFFLLLHVGNNWNMSVLRSFD